jgi:hypothetical protein
MEAAIQAEKKAPKTTIEMPHDTKGSQTNCTFVGAICDKNHNASRADGKVLTHRMIHPDVRSRSA